MKNQDGWYLVDFKDGDPPITVWLWFGEWGVNWGWDEADDPEALPDEATYQPANFALRALLKSASKP